MSQYWSSNLPVLPLLLWGTPPGLELALAQEGIAHKRVRDPHPLAFSGGRFVLFDSRCVAASLILSRLSRDHVAIDVNQFRRDELSDPFEAMVDTHAALARWNVGEAVLTERVARRDKAAIRIRLLDRLRRTVSAGGGLWLRLAAYPFPYQSAFNLRVDLDERNGDDYTMFARARRPLADCCTHFVSTNAYGEEPAVLRDLLRFDTQSHGHFHVIYRNPDANRRNLIRAHDLLRSSGFEPIGFAAPHGRWNPGLDRVLEELGTIYSSDFQLGYDDLPFFPWCGDRFSRVLQVPVHPVCEGLFFDAGVQEGRNVGEYLSGVVRAKVDAGEPAFVYGHPERRLGRHPEILEALDAAVAGNALLWRVTLTEFARWWRWRAKREWSVVPRADGCFEVQFEEWSTEFALGLELVRGRHVASLPLVGPRTSLRPDRLAYRQRGKRPDLPVRRVVDRAPGLKDVVRTALDWETVTPLGELPADTLTDRVKKGLRWWRHASLPSEEAA
jgi:hypothetical protein